jgi:hypothetical protein
MFTCYSTMRREDKLKDIMLALNCCLSDSGEMSHRLHLAYATESALTCPRTWSLSNLGRVRYLHSYLHVYDSILAGESCLAGTTRTISITTHGAEPKLPEISALNLFSINPFIASSHETNAPEIVCSIHVDGLLTKMLIKAAYVPLYSLVALYANRRRL